MIYRNDGEFKLSEDWEILRTNCKEYDGWMCQVCGYQGYDGDPNIDAHHINRPTPGTENIVDDLITLCRSCHSIVESYKDKKKLNNRSDTITYILKEKRMRESVKRFIDISKLLGMPDELKD